MGARDRCICIAPSMYLREDRTEETAEEADISY